MRWTWRKKTNMRTEKLYTGAKNVKESTQELLSTKDVARLFAVSEQTVRKWYRAGELKYIQHGQVIRVTREAVQRFIKANEAAREAKSYEGIGTALVGAKAGKE